MTQQGAGAMTDDDAPKARNPWGMAAIGFGLGAPALMLWLGRGRYSIWYYLAATITSVAVFAVIVTLLSRGFVPLQPLAAIGLMPIIYLALLPTYAVGFLHALTLNRSAALRPWYSRWYIALSAYMIVAYVIAVVVRLFLFQSFDIPSSSGIPNLMTGDMFFAAKLPYRFGDPERGDIAVFKTPKDGKTDYVKRVVGLPGDRVQMKEGRLIINGTMVERTPVDLAPEYAGGPRRLTFYRETLPGGRSYVIAEESDHNPGDDTEEYAVPAGFYFVMGDNRDNSADSRFPDGVGLIPRQNFVGRYALRFWNKQGFPLSGRPEETR